jgi:phosphoglycolate phosphatase-like HAD superfamily hydrolase
MPRGDKAKYTNPKLRERLKKKILAGDKGGDKGEWSARKAQLLTREYEKAAGGYKSSKRTEAQKNLKAWTEEEWMTSDGGPSEREGGKMRYLPKETWENLSAEEKKKANATKRKGDKAGKQFVPNLQAAKEAHALAWAEAFKSEGFDVSIEKIRPLMGMGGDNLAQELVGLSPDDPKSKALSEAWKKIFQEKYLEGVQPFPKVRESFMRMKDAGLRVVIATSAKEEILEGLLGKLDINEFIEGSTNADEAERSKPEPDLVLVALNKLRLEPREVAMLGDTPYDVQAAAKAHVRTIALRSGGFSDDDLVGAIEIYDNPADLLEHFEQSTLAHEQANETLNIDLDGTNETANSPKLSATHQS